MKNLARIKRIYRLPRMNLHCGPGTLKLLIVYILLNGPSLIAQVGVHTDFPDASSAMDISASNKGLLIPRVTLSENLDDPSPVVSPAIGLLVFNSGSNQEMGFYYWDGSLWVPLAGGGGSTSDGWSLTGNYGTQVGDNFIGTTDEEDFAVYTNAMERMRVLANGQVVIDSTAAKYANNLFTVFGNATQNYAINAYSNNVGMYAYAGIYGMVPRVNNATSWPLFAKNLNASGYGAWTIGSNQTNGYYGGRSAGLCSRGQDGIHSYGLSAGGIGIIAMGNGLDPAVIADAGGTFVGAWGVYGRSTNAFSNGTGIIGVGNNLTSSYYLAGGSGGAFTGHDGLFGKSIYANGTGVIGLGNNIGTAPAVLDAGSGGAFTGTVNGAGGWGGTNGLIGWGTNTSDGIGVLGAGNGLAAPILSGGGGGAFLGTAIGSASWAASATGTGVVGAGNNATAAIYTGIGSGGAFTGTLAGAVAWGTDVTNGIGVIGAGNDAAPTLPSAGGCGGAFTGTLFGAYGYSTNSSGIRYGAYYATAPTSGGSYAYVAYRGNGNTNYKVFGNGTVSTIVKNTSGELITLSCPEAPDIVFQDFGIGRLSNGKAHITIDPDLAININVNEKHPLKVYITPEGDCKGVYVTNKSAQGFDVIELQGGQSNISFSWQIVATRANEEYTLKDGSKEISDYSNRFAPAPGPLEISEQPAKTIDILKSDLPENGETSTTTRATSVLQEEQGGKVILIKDEPDGK